MTDSDKKLDDPVVTSPKGPVQVSLTIADVGVSNSVIVAGSGGPYWSEPEQSKCQLQGSHTASADVSQMVFYPDGQVVAYCTECDHRLVIPFIPGGLDAEQMRALGAQVLDPNCDAWTVAFFETLAEQYRRHAEVVAEVAKQNRTIEQVLEKRATNPKL